MTNNEIIELLSASPEAFRKFETAYKTFTATEEPTDMFRTNAKQAAERVNTIDNSETPDVDALVQRIVQALLAQTEIFKYENGTTTRMGWQNALPEGAKPVEEADILALPMELRPQLAGQLVHRDMPFDVGSLLLDSYVQAQNEALPEVKREQMYWHFRQGLDICDLDPMAYEMLGQNLNSIEHWFPPLVEACRVQNFFKLPTTTIAKVPLPLLQLSRMEYESLTPTTFRIVDEWAMRAFSLDTKGDYFVKTGTFSNKFDFRNCRVTTAKEVQELGQYLLYTQYQGQAMAGPLVAPRPIIGACTTNRWVVREFIPDKENCATIYHGLPLHTEYRVFVDCDTDEVLGCHAYWDPEVMKKRFAQDNNAHDRHDYITYSLGEKKLMKRYDENVEAVKQHMATLLPALDLRGQWSVDVMQNGDDFWIIDMALAEQSAFYEQSVPPAKRNATKVSWLPKLPN